MPTAYPNSSVPQNEYLVTPADALRALMVSVHRIPPELARSYAADLTDREVAQHLNLYRRAMKAVKLLTRIRRESPMLWAEIRKWAEQEAASR